MIDTFFLLILDLCNLELVKCRIDLNMQVAVIMAAKANKYF